MSRWLLRALILLLCVVACWDPRPVGAQGPRPAVAVIDVSRSMGPARATVPGGVRTVAQRWLVAAQVRTVGAGAEGSTMARDATDLGAALRDVAVREPGADVLLITDGRATDRDALAAAQAIVAAGGRVLPVVPPRPAADVGLLEARMEVSERGAVAQVRTSASTDGRVRVRLSRGDDAVDEVAADVAAGTSRTLRLEDPNAAQAGPSTYRVTLAPDAGTPNDDPGNDRLDLVLDRPRRRVLVWGDLGQAIAPSGVDVAHVDTLRARDLVGPDVVVLSNGPLAEFRAALPALRRFVASGGQLLVLGGPDAFAAGGWSGSAFERHLMPLHVRVPEGEGFALLLAIDRSGSTADEALGWLQDAAEQTIRGLVPGERLGVLPFAAVPGPLLGPGFVDANDRAAQDTLRDAVRALRAGGQTNVPAAIRASVRVLAREPARTRRVVLLSDGDPDNVLDAQALASAQEALVTGRVEFAAVVVRMRKAVEQLRALSPDVVFLRGSASLPTALAHSMASARGRRERIERPPVASVEPGAGLDALTSMSLAWMHDVRTADHVQLLAASGPAPLVAVRSVGAGQVTALAWGPETEAAGQPRQAATRALAPLVAVLARRADRGLAASLDGIDLVVQGPPGLGSLPLVGPGEDLRGVERGTLLEEQPGVYRAPEPPGAPPSGWWTRLPDGPRALQLPARPDPESRGSGVDMARMQQIARAGGGTVLRGISDWVAPAPRRGISLAPWLLLLATMLFVVERFTQRSAATEAA